MSTTPEAIVVTDNQELSRFEARRAGQLVGFIDYRDRDGVLVLPHTRVFEEFEGQGIGVELVRGVLDMIRERQLDPIDPMCPFIARWVKRHKDYEDLLA